MKRSIRLFLFACSMLAGAQAFAQTPLPPPIVKDSPKSDEAEQKAKILQGKWFMDLSGLPNEKIFLSRTDSSNNYIVFLKDNKFQIHLNEKDCKGVLTGTHQIKLKLAAEQFPSGPQVVELELLDLDAQIFTFDPQKKKLDCASTLIGFLNRSTLETTYFQKEKLMQMKLNNPPALQMGR